MKYCVKEYYKENKYWKLGGHNQSTRAIFVTVQENADPTESGSTTLLHNALHVTQPAELTVTNTITSSSDTRPTCF